MCFRRAILLLLLTAVVLSSGCVFLRLRALQRQLASFQKYCSFSDDPQPTLSLHKPVLYLRDVAWLSGLQPSSVVATNGEHRATWTFVKLYPGSGDGEEVEAEVEEGEEPGSFDVDVVARANRKKKIREVTFPERFDKLLNEEIVDVMFQRAAEGEVDREEGSTAWDVGNSSVLPGMDDILEVAGEPWERREGDETIALDYRFRLERESGEEDEAGEEAEFEATLVYRRGNKGFLRSEVRLGLVRFGMRWVEEKRYKAWVRRPLW